MFNVLTLLHAARCTQAGDATDQWRDQWNTCTATVCPTQLHFTR